jgi:asparagine synthase (glutamine-hydrolysing)
MCGIHFILDKHKKLGPEVISTMASLTRYRGPDHTDIKTAYSAAHTYHLAANRLKITDPSDAAAQPFADQTHALLFNGEIYNYYELKNDLIRKKIKFNSHSDTEVLFHWLKEYGTKEGPFWHQAIILL